MLDSGRWGGDGSSDGDGGLTNLKISSLPWPAEYLQKKKEKRQTKKAPEKTDTEGAATAIGGG